MRFSQNDLVQVTRENEVTPGVVVGGARDRVYGTAPTWSPAGSSNVSAINTGAARFQGVRAGLRYPNVEIFDFHAEPSIVQPTAPRSAT